VLEEQIGRAALTNVRIVAHGELPYVYLQAADVLVTKFSTLGVEAMYMDRPVIAAILDGERRFHVFGDAAEYVETADELRALLESLIEPGEFDRWREEQLMRAKAHLERLFFHSNRAPTELIADVLIDLVSEGKNALSNRAPSVVSLREEGSWKRPKER
jgi:hypothetical protein